MGKFQICSKHHSLFVAPALTWAIQACKFLSVCMLVCPSVYFFVHPSIHPNVHPKWRLQTVKLLQLVSLHWLFCITKLNKDDNSHSSGACFHILVCRCNIHFIEILYSYVPLPPPPPSSQHWGVWWGGGVHIFYCRSCWCWRWYPCWHSLLSVVYLLNEWMDFGHTYTNLSLGGGKDAD